MADVLPVVRGTYSATGSNEPASLLTGAETRVGDVLIAWHAVDWDSASIMGAPWGTAGEWTELHDPSLSDLGVNSPHLKAWTRRATTNGQQRVTVNATWNTDAALIVVVIDGSTVRPANEWIDAATGTKTATYTTTHVGPSLSMAGDRDRLLVAVASGLNSSTATPINYSPISPLSELREIDSAAWITLSVGTIGFIGSGNSGARGFVSSVSRYFVAAAVAVRGAEAANPIDIDLVPVQVHVTTQPGVVAEMTGRTLDLAPLRQRWALQRAEMPGETDLLGAPITVTAERQQLSINRDVPLRGAPIRVDLALQAPTITNLSVTPLRVRVGLIRPDVEIESITPLTDRSQRPTSQTYVRPRKNLRFLAQEVLSRKWVSWDLPLREPELTWNINAANEITGKIDAREVAGLGLDEWSHYIHCEQNGEIRNSGILLPWASGGPELTVTAAGVTRYPHGQPYTGNFSLGYPAVGVDIDPLDVVRHCWDHLQSFPDGRLGVIVSAVKSPVRIGEPPRDVNFETGEGEQVAFTAGPYLLKWYEETDIGKEIDDLAKETPFDYRESSRWNATRDDVEMWIELGFPRLGRDQRTLTFAEGENLIDALTPVEDDDRYASEVTLLGKGEGSARVRGRSSVRVPGRVRRATVVEVKNADSTARANALAADELAGRRGLLEVDEVHLLGQHPNAAFGSFAAGDDVPVRMTVDGYGRVIIRHRITGYTYRPEVSDLTVRTKRSDSFSYRGAESSGSGGTPTPAPIVAAPTPEPPAAPSGFVLAAQEILDRVQSGLQYFEDFTYPGSSANLATYNDELVTRWERAHPGTSPEGSTVVSFLQNIITNGG